MSTIVRDAIVRIKLEQQKGSLQSPEMAGAKRHYEEAAKATREVEKANKEATRATVEHTRATQEFGIRSAASFREAGEGAFRMVRGLALLSSSGSDDLQKLIQKVALAQGAFDVFAGSTKVIANLPAGVAALTASFGPVGLVIGVVSTAIGGAIIAWNEMGSAASRAKEEAEKFNAVQQTSLKLAEQMGGKLSREARDAAEMRSIERELARTAGTPAQQRSQLAGLDASLEKQRREQQEQYEVSARNQVQFLSPAFKIRSMEMVADSEQKQLDFIRERVEVAREMHQLDQQDLARRVQAAQQRDSHRASSLGMPLAPGDLGGNVQGVTREGEAIAVAYAATMRKLLDAMKAQQAEVNQIAEEVIQAKNAAAGR